MGEDRGSWGEGANEFFFHVEVREEGLVLWTGGDGGKVYIGVFSCWVGGEVFLGLRHEVTGKERHCLIGL